MSEKKRKRHEEGLDGPPSKKFAKESPSQNIKVSVIEDGDEWLPVLASMPGLIIPSTLSMNPYTKSRLDASRSSLAIPELLLHSSAHLKLEYTAREESSNGSESHLKHYIGVYDPEAGRLQLVQARKLVIRSTLRSSDHDEKGSDSEKDGQNNRSARSNLGLAFGTKKTQKAIRALSANAIKASPTKAKSQTPGTGRALDPVASAVVSSMAQFASSMPTREQLQADIDANKPVPKPNLAAETPADVYPVEQLVGGTNVLRNMNVQELMDKVKSGKDVKTKSLFVSSRLQGVVLSDDVKRVRTLRYLLLLLEWYKGLKAGHKGAKKVPNDEEMGSLIEQYGSEVVRGVGRRFAERGELNKWHLENLIIHICALTLTLDNFTTDTHDIREDLKLDSKDVQKYFQELGCAIALPTEIERGKLKMTKAERVGHRIARLRLPLVFPKMRVPMAGKKKK
ncbi:MAG: DNA-directed RNA polymerase I subunit rpa49 [Alectoria sarmentosa]|nr:MAG: DNA-directed RNA polymerase I subunit rpa49 [Alectoria sarmentosa]